MKKFELLIISLFIYSIFLPAQNSWEKYFERKSYSSGNYILNYQLYKPSVTIDPGRPLIIFLHGAGERGNDNHSQLTHGVGHFMTDSIREKYHFELIVPQCPEDERWVETDWTKPSHVMSPQPSVIMQCLFNLIDSIVATDSIDPDRIYITGLSMGGFGTWDAIQRRPFFFAAAAPVCGGGDEKQASQLVSIPIRIYHGKLDHLVIPARSINMYNAIRAAGGTMAELTLFPDLGHLCWEKVYSDPSFYQWLFKQKKNNDDK